MTAKLCLRCDWHGDTEEPRCPTCGARPLFVAAPPGDRRPPAPLEDPVGSEHPPAPRDGHGRRIRVAVAISVVALVVALGTWISSDPAPTSASGPARGDGGAATAAAGFLRAYGELDADRAIGFLADDADLSLLVRSIGAEDVEGTEREFRWYVDLLGAWRYQQTLGSCDEIESSDPDTVVRCGFDYDFLGSDDLGLGPYTGSSFDVAVRDGEVVSVSKFWAFDRFSREMWEPFGEWIASAHPGAATRMYQDPSRRGVRLDLGSIRRWARYTDAFVRLKVTQRVVPHDDG